MTLRPWMQSREMLHWDFIMIKTLTFFSTVVITLLAGLHVTVGMAAPPKPMRVEVRQLPDAISAATKSLNAKFIVATPAESAGTAPLPLLIFLHGSGQRGSDIEMMRDAPPIQYFNSQTTQPFVIIVPQVRSPKDGVKHTWEADDLERLFSHLEKTVTFYKSRVYLTGYSMGGYGTWAWAAAHPERFAALSPHAGGLGHGGPKDVTPDLDAWAKRLAPLPVRIVHGAKDVVVPPELSERMAKALKSHSATEVELIILPDKAHNISDGFANAELYAWLLKHSRSAEKRSKP